jgi:RNA polymerase sigma factor (sigma-70 family)
VWSIARAHRLSDADAGDVHQFVWLRLVERLDDIREPERIGAWLAAVTRHECLRVLRKAGRESLTEDEADFDQLERHPGSDLAGGLLVAERDALLWAAFEELPERCRTLLRVLMADPRPSYDVVAAALDMPIGSIGPTRQRCLERLRRHPELAGIKDAW